MDIRKRHPDNPEIKQFKKGSVFIPDGREIAEMDFEQLHESWKKNHEILRNELQDTSPPFFALHGTSQESSESILATEGSYVQVCTFYDKDYESDDFLYKLYDAVLYASTYAKNRGETLGRIIVFDVEKDGENATSPWEHLYTGSRLQFTLTQDSDEAKIQLRSLQNVDNLLYRSDMYTRGANKVMGPVGVVDMRDMEELINYNKHDRENFRRVILRERFVAQQIITRILELFKKEPEAIDTE